MSEPASFFILGYPRSGTTALADLINASDRAACISYEGNVLYRLQRALSREQALEEPHEDLLLDFEISARHNLIDKPTQGRLSKPLFSAEAISDLVEGFASDLEGEKNSDELFQRTTKRFFHLLAATGDFAAVGDKVPDYINIPESLYSALPEARFLYITRDPRAAVHSVLRFSANTLHLFAVPDALAMAVAWLLRRRGIERFRQQESGARLLELRQEELKNDPMQVAKKASDFLGVVVDDSMKRHAASVTQSIKDWRTQMALEDIHAVEAVVFSAGLRDIDHYTRKPGENDWVEKASALLPLADCSEEEIPKRSQDARRLFQGDGWSKRLGLALLQMAEWDHLQAQPVRAQLLFDAAERLIPSDPVFLYRYGECCFDVKMLDTAQRLFSRTVETCPDRDYFRFLRAKSFYQLGRIERLRGSRGAALEFFTRSAAEYPPFSLPRAMISLLEKTGGTSAFRLGALH